MDITELVKKFKELPKPVRQIILGTSSGFLSGYFTSKVGKTTASSIGASILLLQIGYQLDIIKIDWKALKKIQEKAKDEVEKQAATHIPDLRKKIQDIASGYHVFWTCYLGSFVLGLSAA